MIVSQNALMDMENITFQLSDVPGNFALCLNSECPLAERCLHQMVRRMVAADELVLHVYNPEVVRGGKDCEYFRALKLDRYAKGFTRFQEEMKPRQYAVFSGSLMAQFGRNPYYERRRGERLLSPAEQEVVLQALRKAGIEENLEFDGYEYRINWID